MNTSKENKAKARVTIAGQRFSVDVADIELPEGHTLLRPGESEEDKRQARARLERGLDAGDYGI